MAEQEAQWKEALAKYDRVLYIAPDKGNPANDIALKKFKEISLIIGKEAEQKQDFDLDLVRLGKNAL